MEPELTREVQRTEGGRQAAAPAPRGAAQGSVRAGLRGLDLARQEAMLAPIQQKRGTSSSNGAVPDRSAPAGAAPVQLEVASTPAGGDANAVPGATNTAPETGANDGAQQAEGVAPPKLSNKEAAPAPTDCGRDTYMVNGSCLRLDDKSHVEIRGDDGTWTELTVSEAAKRGLDQDMVSEGADPDTLLTLQKGKEAKDAKKNILGKASPEDQLALNEFLTGSRAKFRDGLKAGEQYQKRRTLPAIGVVFGVPIAPFVEVGAKYEYGLLEDPFDGFDAKLLALVGGKVALSAPLELGAKGGLSASAGLSAGFPDFLTLDLKGTLSADVQATASGKVELDYEMGDEPSWDNLKCEFETEVSGSLNAAISLDGRVGFPPYACSIELLKLAGVEICKLSTSSKAVFDFASGTLRTVKPFDPSEWEFDFGNFDDDSFFSSLFEYFQADDDANKKVQAFKKAGLLDKLPEVQRMKLLDLLDDSFTDEEHEQSMVDVVLSASSPDERMRLLKRHFESQQGVPLMTYDQLTRFVSDAFIDDNASACSALLRQIDEDLAAIEPWRWAPAPGPRQTSDFIFHGNPPGVPESIRKRGHEDRELKKQQRQADADAAKGEKEQALEAGRVSEVNQRGAGTDLSGNPIEHVAGGAESTSQAPTHAHFRPELLGLEGPHIAALARAAGVQGALDYVPVELATPAQQVRWVLDHIGVRSTSFGDPIGAADGLMSLRVDDFDRWAREGCSVVIRATGLSATTEQFTWPRGSAADIEPHFQAPTALAASGYLLVRRLAGDVPAGLRQWLLDNVSLNPATLPVRVGPIEMDEAGQPQLAAYGSVDDVRPISAVDVTIRTAGPVVDGTEWPDVNDFGAMSLPPRGRQP